MLAGLTAIDAMPCGQTLVGPDGPRPLKLHVALAERSPRRKGHCPGSRTGPASPTHRRGAGLRGRGALAGRQRAGSDSGGRARRPGPGRLFFRVARFRRTQLHGLLSEFTPAQFEAQLRGREWGVSSRLREEHFHVIAGFGERMSSRAQAQKPTKGANVRLRSCVFVGGQAPAISLCSALLDQVVR